MDFTNLIKKFVLPADFSAPEKLSYADIVARPLTRKDLLADIKGVNSSLEVIRQTRGGSWPEETLTEDFDFLDLAWHEREFRDYNSFAYVVYDINGRYIGCFYLYPMGVRTSLSEEFRKYDCDVSWWVTAETYKQGYYEKLYEALQQWVTNFFPFERVYYSNKEIPR